MTPSGDGRHFHHELHALRSLLLEMSEEVEALVRQAVAAMVEQDGELAREVVEGDSRVDELELRIDRMAHELLALQQPLASDLRSVTTTMKIARDLERVGDHAVNIAEATHHLTLRHPFGQVPEILEMAGIALEMLTDALDAFIRRDAAAAREVRTRDDRVDHLHNSIFRVLLTHMMEDPRQIGPSMAILLISKNLERVADLATNVAEEVVFLVEGTLIRHGSTSG